MSLVSFRVSGILLSHNAQTQSDGSFLPQGLIQSIPFYVSDVHRTILRLIYIEMLLQNHPHKLPDLHNLCTIYILAPCL